MIMLSYHTHIISSALITLGVRHHSTLVESLAAGVCIVSRGMATWTIGAMAAADPPVLSRQRSFLASLSKLHLLANWLHNAFLDPQEALPLDQ